MTRTELLDLLTVERFATPTPRRDPAAVEQSRERYAELRCFELLATLAGVDGAEEPPVRGAA